MIEQFVAQFVKYIASEPDLIRVEKRMIDDSLAEIIIYASKSDAGKIIGKEGKMISAIKTVISGCKAKDGISYRVMVKAPDDI